MGSLSQYKAAFPDLKGKVVIVTGSTRGIGYEIARVFKEMGSRVVVNARNANEVQDTVKRLSEEISEGEVIGVVGDVSRYEDCENIVKTTVDRFSRVDVLVNNAGINMIRDSLNLSIDDWERTLRIDLFGAFYMSQLVARVMVSKRIKGSIINIASMVGPIVALPKRAAYAAAKAGLVGLTRVLAVEWAPLGIRVNAIAPGYIWSSAQEVNIARGEYTRQDIEGRVPMGRYGDAREVAYVAAFLASELSSYVTGALITVDGGWTVYGGWERLLRQIQEAARQLYQ
ncbi:MAG: SDR family oxidoreductase [Caldivirga sp.]|jgi:NAD(P)-dependent dehydrogenase (short-subunit alcohol dehydrogenase family)